ncbi:helix-turn-helix transcriptional regulator [Chloroflexi bacterium TSY]|nr:helix-turn-helix transcriptional regulator [Chloroflexi bacterium TSY]
MTLLESPQSPATEALLTLLLNDVATAQDKFLLVLDDYHVLESSAIDDALTFLLDHMPPQIHLVVTTREDPSLPLASYRARGQMTELRATDLRFTPAEAAEFLNQMMGLNLSQDEVAALETRTEGWIAGLQMAALSMQGRSDITGFIKAFTGSHRFVLDYLAEEVLQRQSEDMRSFLLHTAILDRLSGPLCNAVTGREDSQRMLVALERGNLFVIPLDDERIWYRYHHLFADVLQTWALDEHPDQIPLLHRCASEWYEQNGQRIDAIRHAFAAEEFARAAALVELAWPVIPKGIPPTTWLGWVNSLPAELLRTRPVLSAGAAWMLIDSGELEAAEARLREAELWLGTESGSTPEPSAEMVVVNHDEFQSLPQSIAVARAYLALSHGDFTTAAQNVQRALNLLTEEEYYWRGGAALFLGMAYFGQGDMEAAYRTTADSVASLGKAGNIPLQEIGTTVLADIRRIQGRLGEAKGLYAEALDLARSDTHGTRMHLAEQNASLLQTTADLFVGLSELYLERGDLDTATKQVTRGKELGKQQILSGSESRLCISMARIKESEGDLQGALNQVQTAERLYKRDAIPDVRPIAAFKARILAKQGRLSDALVWVCERGLSVDDVLSYRIEFEHITLVRVLIAEYRSEQTERSLHDATKLLVRLLDAAKAHGRMGSVIEILVLQALIHQTQGDRTAALVSLGQALTLAEPEGYIQVFADEGKPMQTLLAESLSRSKFGVFGYFQSRLQGFWSHLFRFRLQKTTYFISENRPNLTQKLDIDRQICIYVNCLARILSQNLKFGSTESDARG